MPRPTSRTTLVTLALSAALAAAPGAASAARVTRYVDDDRAQCATAGYAAIQPAINASAPGDRVIVCNGTYPGSLTIGQGKDGLSLTAQVKEKAIITPPAGPGVQTLIDVTAAEGVSIQRFKILATEAAPARWGIALFWDARDAPLSVLIRYNRIEGMWEHGIAAWWGTARILDNVIRDIGRPDALRPSAIDVDSATPYVYGNDIGALHGAAGVLVRYHYGTGLIGGNRIAGVATGISLSDSFGSELEVSGNVITGSETGIGAYHWMGGGDPQPNGAVDPDLPYGGTQIVGNRVTGNGRGIVLSGGPGLATQGLVLRKNVVQRNGYGILAVQEGPDPELMVHTNWIGGNDARFNTVRDCYQGWLGILNEPVMDAGNTWYRNRGPNSLPAGLCG